MWSCTPVIPALGRLEAEESGFQGHSWLHSNLEARLGLCQPSPLPYKKLLSKHRNKNSEIMHRCCVIWYDWIFLLCTAKLAFFFLAFHLLSLCHIYRFLNCLWCVHKRVKQGSDCESEDIAVGCVRKREKPKTRWARWAYWMFYLATLTLEEVSLPVITDPSSWVDHVRETKGMDKKWEISRRTQNILSVTKLTAIPSRY